MSLTLNVIQDTVCKLISVAMFNNHEIFDADIEWDNVREELRSQAVLGLLLHVLPNLSFSEDSLKSWRDECLQVMNNGIRLRFMQADFLKNLEKAKIPYVILKGTAAAMYYPDSLLRDMGDVDVYIPVQFHEKVKGVMIADGYIQIQNEEDNGRHIIFIKNTVRFEIHRKYATVNSAKERNYIDDLLEDNCKRSLSKRLLVTQGGISFYAPNVYVNGLVLLEHIGMHIISGLGLRQIIDWMMFVKDSLHDAEWNSFQEMAKKAGLEMLAKTVTKLCIRYLGLEGEFFWCMDAEDETVEELLLYLFDSGNFGNKNRSSGQISSVHNRFRSSKSIFNVLQEAGEHNWKLYRHHRYLRPFAWLYQFFRYAHRTLFIPGKLKTIKAGMEEAERRANLMASLGISLNSHG